MKSLQRFNFSPAILLYLWLALSYAAGVTTEGASSSQVLLTRRQYLTTTNGDSIVTQQHVALHGDAVVYPKRVRGRRNPATVLAPIRSAKKPHQATPSAEIHLRSTINSHFTGKVLVGTPPQEFNLVFDTGSTNLQVVAVDCNQPSCVKVRRYDPKRSSTFKPVPAPSVEIAFGTGRILANLGTDAVAVGPYKLIGLPFGMIFRESTLSQPNLFDLIDFEGIIGLGLPSLEITRNSTVADRILREQNASPEAWEFAIYISNPQAPELAEVFDREPALHVEVPATLMIGGVDPMFYVAPITMLPVSTSNRYWQTELAALYAGDVQLCCLGSDRENYLVFDSGTTYNTFPAVVLEQLEFLLPLSCRRDTHNQPILSDYPTLRYMLANGAEIVITPEMYVVEAPTDDCEVAMMNIDVSPSLGRLFVLGEVAFMRHYFTVYRRNFYAGPSMMGFAKARHSPEGLARISSLRY